MRIVVVSSPCPPTHASLKKVPRRWENLLSSTTHNLIEFVNLIEQTQEPQVFTTLYFIAYTYTSHLVDCKHPCKIYDLLLAFHVGHIISNPRSIWCFSSSGKIQNVSNLVNSLFPSVCSRLYSSVDITIRNVEAEGLSPKNCSAS